MKGRLEPGFEVVDREVYGRAVDRFREANIQLPTLRKLAESPRYSARLSEDLERVDPDEPNPLNLFRVHWYNDPSRRRQVEVPVHVELPGELTGVDARIVVVLGSYFPMIGAHKVLAAYGCLAPRIVTGRFDPTSHRAVWPSTGNYCRGGVAISRIMGCRGVAVLPEGMSRERFEWLNRWVAEPKDITRTPGTESNVKEIYDKCVDLSKDSSNIILNQFSEFGNHLVHYLCTGKALARVYESLRATTSGLKLRGFVAASGSAGTLAAGDYLKEQYNSRIVAVEAEECPTMLLNGFGEHNIKGIGDKHIPLIHNVMNTDVAAAISDVATDQLLVLFNTDVGWDYLAKRRGVSADTLEQLGGLGISSICNILAAVRTARYYRLGSRDLVITVSTDGAAMYRSEVDRLAQIHFPDGFDLVAAAETFGRHVLGASTGNFVELSTRDRERILNLGYFTWVEQQGVSVEDFETRRSQQFWKRIRDTADNGTS